MSFNFISIFVFFHHEYPFQILSATNVSAPTFGVSELEEPTKNLTKITKNLTL